MEASYTSKTIQKTVGLTRQKIDYLILKGAVSPSNDSEGTGNYRTFSYSNLIEFKLATQLLGQIKISSMKRVKFIIENTKECAEEYFEKPSKGSDSIIEPKLVIIRFPTTTNQEGNIVNVRNLEETFSLIRRQHAEGRPFFIISLDAIRAEIIESLK